MKNIFKFILISAIIGLISSKTEKFLSEFETKNPSIAPASFLQLIEEKIKEPSNGINLEKFLRNYRMIIPKDTSREEDYLVKDANDQKRVKFNFLKNTKYSPDATVVKLDGDQTIKLSGKKDIKNTYINTLDNYSGVVISFKEEGDICNENGKRHQTTFLVKCDYSNKNLCGGTKFTSDDDNCNHLIEMSFSFGCSLVSGVKLYKFFNKYKDITGLVMFVLGIVISYLGAIHFKINIFLISGSTLCFLIASLILLVYPELFSTEIKIIISLGVSFIIGSLLGIYLVNKLKYVVAILGGLLGYYAFTFVYDLLSKIFTIENDYYYYGPMILAILVGIMLNFRLAIYVAMFGTAVFGGYVAASQGLAIMFPDYADYSQIFWILVSGLSFYYQWRKKDKIKSIFDTKIV